MADAFEDNAKNSLAELKKIKEITSKIDVPPERVFAGFDAYEKAPRRRTGRRFPLHAARFSSDALCRRHPGRQTRVHGKAVLRGRPGLSVVDGNQ